jgi:hypothetical protein
MTRSLTRCACGLAVGLAGLTAVALAPAAGYAARPPAPHWVAFSQQAPTDFHPGDTRDFYEIVAVNDGGADTQGPLTVTDTLPAGVIVDADNAAAEVAGASNNSLISFAPGCTKTSSKGVVTVVCRTNDSVPVGRSIQVNLNIEVPAGAKSGEQIVNTVTITGGGAPEAKTDSSTLITEPSIMIPFGASFATDLTEAGGNVDRQAGSHPFAFTTLTMFNVAAVNPEQHGYEGHSPAGSVAPNAQPRDIEVPLPAGLVGNATAVPSCSQTQFEVNSAEGCPPDTQVGMIYLEFYGPGGSNNQASPVYNIQPPPGVPAELGFTISIVSHIPIFFHVRSDGDYGVTADLSNVNQFATARMAFLSIWGNPSDEAHNPLRISRFANCSSGCPSGVVPPKPFLRTPTSCGGGELSIPLLGDSWQDPESAPFRELSESSVAGMAGCEALRFAPSVAVSANSHQANAPAAYTVNLHVPQNEEPEALATPDVRDAEVSLPEGTAVSPSAANGLSSCSDEQFGLKVRSAGHCPAASRLGSVKITTPLLANQVKGNLYAGEPECSPCSPADTANGRMLRVFLEAEAEGVIVKQAGHARINQATGRVTTVFKDTPQLPFSELEVALEPGENAALTNPTKCGPAVTDASITPWSSSTPTSVQSAFQVNEGCTPGFSPTFQAGTTPTHAGGFAGFSMTLSHNDGEQTLGRVSVTMPPGLLGVLKNVEQCPEPQAKNGGCPAGSQIGTGSVVVGPGSSPLEISGSKVYLTGPYDNQPFGLSIVTPTVAGPFVLSGNAGNATEVVRASIAIDPHTSALTVTSEPLPQALNGVPLDIRTIHIDVNHIANFTFNPTNCNTMAVAGTVTSTTGTTSNVSSPFRATACNQLPFKPTFKVSTQGKTSKKGGASLHVNVTSGQGQANIAKVKVDLPIQLPSRLSTLQKACVDHVFDANPASCPAASIVGHATAVTPLLAHSLTGPAYLVSHAGAAFPDLEVVLQGERITLILDGNTDIKKGITSSFFQAVPDAPIDSFDLVLPEGPHSALSAFGNLCTSKLNMPTQITGQNGGVVKQTTKITATGCPKRHAKAHAGKKRA